jgi:hypothetical protein
MVRMLSKQIHLFVLAGIFLINCDPFDLNDGDALPVDSGATSPAQSQTRCNSDSGAKVELRSEEMSRWNLAMIHAKQEFDFSWTRPDEFPHPTLAGGSQQAYASFANVFGRFVESEDTVNFLASKCRFESAIKHVFPSGQTGIETSWKQLATEISNGVSTFAFASVEDRAAARVFLNKMLSP